MAKLRGSKWAELLAIHDTLQLALDTSGNEKQLRQYISGIIKNIKRDVDKLEKNAHKR